MVVLRQELVAQLELRRRAGVGLLARVGFVARLGKTPGHASSGVGVEHVSVVVSSGTASPQGRTLSLSHVPRALVGSRRGGGKHVAASGGSGASPGTALVCPALLDSLVGAIRPLVAEPHRGVAQVLCGTAPNLQCHSSRHQWHCVYLW